MSSSLSGPEHDVTAVSAGNAELARVTSRTARLEAFARAHDPALAWSFLAVLGILLIATALYSGADLTWLALLVVALVGGTIAGVFRNLWLLLGTVVAGYVLAGVLGTPASDQPLWLVDLLAVETLAGVAFVAGTTPLRRGRASPSESEGLGIRHRGVAGSWITRALVASGLAVIFYGASAGVIGVGTWTASKGMDCRTPMYAYGWPYQAINYDQASDAALAPRQKPNAAGQLVWTCDGEPVTAGIEVVTTDDVRIAGWYIPAGAGIGEAGPTVVIVPGGKSNKSEALKYAPPLHDQYNLVLLDNRAMGQSSSTRAFGMGATEKRDVEAIIDWLERTKGPSWIAALGNSMGAATALSAAAEDTRIRALVLDSMHARAVVATSNIIEKENHLPAIPAAWAIVSATSLTAGADVASADPVRRITLLGDRPVLLIHGTADVLDPPEQAAEQNFAAAFNAGIPVELHYCPGATHGRLVDDPQCAADWIRWTLTFLEGARSR